LKLHYNNLIIFMSKILRRLPEMLKSPNDKLIYTPLELKNKLKIVLIEDKTSL